MTAIPPDPDPADTPDLEPGGGVSPGATPPDSAQVSGVGAVDPPVGRRRVTPMVVISVAAIVILLLLFLSVVVFVLFGGL
ncbi:DUF6480 family protein [Mycolicibacterium phlei]